MKKIILILLLPIVLSACAVLMVGCGGHGQDGKKGATVIDQPKQEADCND